MRALAERVLGKGKDPLAQLFPAQRAPAAALMLAGARVVLQCGRRAGKTETVEHVALALMRRRAGAQCAYLALTRTSAERILWPKLIELNDRLGLELDLNHSKLTARMPNGSLLVLAGADRANEVEKLRGQAWDLVMVDEAASFRRAMLEYLIDDVLSASLMDHDGRLCLLGTPGAACVGYFHDACTQGRWQHFHWTALDNPHIKDARGWMAREMAFKSWTRDTPSARREYFGEWVRDTNTLVFGQLSRERNYLQTLAANDNEGWRFVIGIDYGYVDATAWAVWAYRTDDSGDKRAIALESFRWPFVPDRYLPEGVDRTQGLLASDAAAITKKLYAAYQGPAGRVSATVGDAGGLGKEYIEEARRRWDLPITNAHKSHKNAQIQLINDGLGSGQIQILEATNRHLLDEMAIVQWDLERVEVRAGGVVKHEDRKCVDKRYDDHLCDAMRYGFMEVYAYLNDSKPPAKTERVPRKPPWAPKQAPKPWWADFRCLLPSSRSPTSHSSQLSCAA